MIQSYLTKRKVSFAPRYVISCINRSDRPCYAVSSFFEAQFFASLTGYEVQMMEFVSGTYKYSCTLQSTTTPLN